MLLDLKIAIHLSFATLFDNLMEYPVAHSRDLVHRLTPAFLDQRSLMPIMLALVMNQEVIPTIKGCIAASSYK